MVKLTNEMKEMIGKQLAIVATVDENGNPNIGPKRSMRLYDDSTLIFNENTAGQTKANIVNNGKIEIAYIDRENLLGYRLVGKAEVLNEGPFFEEAKAWAKGKMAEPKFVGIVKVERVFNLQSGANAGKEIIIK